METVQLTNREPETSGFVRRLTEIIEENRNSYNSVEMPCIVSMLVAETDYSANQKSYSIFPH